MTPVETPAEQGLKEQESDDFMAALRKGTWLDFAYNSQPKCPHCGTDIDLGDNDWHEVYSEGEYDVECPKCDGAFVVSTCVTYSFSTAEQEGYE